ncbi:MAG: NAD-dependent epimerase/dehydratase family protein, partial [Myxococcales bacterium]|nr:NAD-dependent epimerase/dehydratase family protein [Myxococcales bacterium]
MKIFLTGATGFMGQAIVRALTSRGDVARVWTRDAARARAALGAGVECVTARRDADAPVESMAAAMV